MSDQNRDIRDWGARNQPPPVDTQEQTRKILEKLRKEIPEPKPFPLWSALARSAAAAALLALGIVIGLSGRGKKPDEIVKFPKPASPQGLTQTDIQELRVVADEITRLFPEGLQWIAKIDGQVSFRPAAVRRVDGDGTESRLVVVWQVQQQRADGAWQEVSRHEVVTWSDEPVELGAGKQLWCHLADAEHAAISTDLTLKVSERELHLATENLQTLQQPLVIMEQISKESPIRLVQSVYRL